MSNEEMKRAMEAILFAAGESVEITRIAQSLEITPKKAESLLEELKEEFNSQNHGFKLMRYKDNFQFVTHIYKMENKKQIYKTINTGSTK